MFLFYLQIIIHICPTYVIGGQVIRTVKCAVDLVLLSKKDVLLQGMTERLTEIGRCYGLEINVEKSKVMRMSRQPSPIQIMI